MGSRTLVGSGRLKLSAIDGKSHPVALRLAALVLAIAIGMAAIGIFLAIGTASAQENAGCAAASLGQLSDSGSGLQASGRWSTQDCESELRPGSDTQYFDFELVTGGRVRIELTSQTADPYLTLFAADGNRIADGGGGLLLDARIERELDPGMYRVEATTTGGRRHGAADFSLTIGFVEGCGFTPPPSAR